MKKLFFLTVATLLSSATQAALVTGVTSSNTSIATVAISNIVHTPLVVPGVDAGSFTLDVEVFQKHLPVSFNFSFLADSPGFPVGPFNNVTRAYEITMNVLNSLAPEGSRDYMNGFDVLNGANGGGISTAQIDNFTPGSSAYFAFEPSGDPFNSYNVPGGFRFGGLSGGGNALFNGQSNSVTFTYIVTSQMANGGNSSLIFTANPEPGTMVLAGLALLPVGVVVRRRRKAAAQDQEAVAEV